MHSCARGFAYRPLSCTLRTDASIDTREHFGLPESEITLATALKEQGYRTACIGKWHLGDLPPYRPNRHGLDEFYGLLYSNDMTLLPAVNWPPMRLYQNNEVIQSHVKQKTLTQCFTEAGGPVR